MGWRLERKTCAVLALVAAAGACTADPGNEASSSAAETDRSLQIEFLGTMGFLIRSGDNAVMTAPLYTNPTALDAFAGRVVSNKALVDRFTEHLRLDDVRAIISGHAHYDHLMDVPYVWAKTNGAWIYANRSAKHLLAAYAPDREPRCAKKPRAPLTIPRWRIVAMDDPDQVDGRLCGDAERIGAEHQLAGGLPIHLQAFCSEHPAQVGPFHYGAGSVDRDKCEVEQRLGEWKEGETLSFLIDFLDPLDRTKILHRIYYQDAPTLAPIGHVPASVLAQHPIDVALLCVGSFPGLDAFHAEEERHPTAFIRAMSPRYVISGHWEDFFRPQDQPIQGLPGHDLAEYDRRAVQALADHAEPPISVDGQWVPARHFRPLPGTRFVFPAPAAVAPIQALPPTTDPPVVDPQPEL